MAGSIGRQKGSMMRFGSSWELPSRPLLAAHDGQREEFDYSSSLSAFSIAARNSFEAAAIRRQRLGVVEVFPSGAQRHHALAQERHRLVPLFPSLAFVAQASGHSFD